MQTYTVIGFYSDNSQRFATCVTAATPDDAEAAAHKEVEDDPDNSGDLHICAVLEGDHKCVDTEADLNPPLRSI